MIAIVSHDAGGAEILSSWVHQQPLPYCLVIDGPAIPIFQRKLGKLRIYSLEQAIKLCDWVLCGSSWQSNLEKQAIFLAKESGKKTITFLDHWVNYPERFHLDDVAVYPDEIWVGDVDAQKIAESTFSEIKVVLQPNPYFKDMVEELAVSQSKSEDSCQSSVLYVCEPISEYALLTYGNERYWGYTETDALRFFLENFSSLGSPVSEIKIRPHPSESKSKYDWATLESPLAAYIESSKSLIEQILEADVVVGCESMAMVIGLLAKKRVISSVPIGGKACSLPQAEIEHLQVLVKKSQDSR